jgi:hypothetical protein
MPKQRAGSSGRHCGRLQLEILEDRRLLSGLPLLQPTTIVFPLEAPSPATSAAIQIQAPQANQSPVLFSDHGEQQQASGNPVIPHAEKFTVSLGFGQSAPATYDKLSFQVQSTWAHPSSLPATLETAQIQVSAISLAGDTLSQVQVRSLTQGVQQTVASEVKGQLLEGSGEEVAKLVDLANHHLSAKSLLSPASLRRLETLVEKVEPGERAESIKDILSSLHATLESSLANEPERLEHKEQQLIAVEEVEREVEHLLPPGVPLFQDGEAHVHGDPIAEAALAERFELPWRVHGAQKEDWFGADTDGQPGVAYVRVNGYLEADSEETIASLGVSHASAEPTLDEAGALASLAPEMAGALDRALQQFLGQIDDLGEELSRVLAGSGLASWLMVLAVAGAAAEATRWQVRRRSQLRFGLAAACGDATLSWISGWPRSSLLEEA